MSTKKTKVSEICVRYCLSVTVLFLTLCSEQWLLTCLPNVNYNIMSKQNKRAEWNAGPKIILFYIEYYPLNAYALCYKYHTHVLATFCTNLFIITSYKLF